MRAEGRGTRGDQDAWAGRLFPGSPSVRLRGCIAKSFRYLWCGRLPVDSARQGVKIPLREAVTRLSNREVYNSVWNRSC